MKEYQIQYTYIDQNGREQTKEERFISKETAELKKEKIIDSLDTLKSIQIQERFTALPSYEQMNLFDPSTQTEPTKNRLDALFEDKPNDFIFALVYTDPDTKQRYIIYAKQYYSKFEARLTVDILFMKYFFNDKTRRMSFAKKDIAIYSILDKYKRKFKNVNLIKEIINLLEDGVLDIVSIKDPEVMRLVTEHRLKHIEEITGYNLALFF